MTKVKTKRRMKKTVRRTLGALFLASSIVVAAIPTSSYRGGEAQADSSEYTQPETLLEIGGTHIKDGTVIANAVPTVNTGAKIYTTGDGNFQFAYVNTNGQESGTRYGVILGYSFAGNLENGTLKIPDTVNAYAQYNPNEGTGGGYCAVGRSGNFLFYRIPTITREKVNEYDRTQREADLTAEGVNTTFSFDFSYDENGVAETVQVNDQTYNVFLYTITRYTYEPCYYSDVDNWYGATEDQRNNFDPANLYYFNTADNKPASGYTATTDISHRVQTTDEAYQWIKDATVAYIGEQYLSMNSAGVWSIAGTVTGPANGIFYNRANIVNLETGNNLAGIGAYAFYGCGNLVSFTTGNGLTTIGNHAFDNCYSLQEVTLPVETALKTVGSYAFKDNISLTGFNFPGATETICDGVFCGCTKLKNVTMPHSLLELGYYAFQGCSSLENIEFGELFSQRNATVAPVTNTVEMSTFQGCTSLTRITVNNSVVSFTDSSNGHSNDVDGTAIPSRGSKVDFTLQDFANSVTEQFYFEGPYSASSATLAALHTTSRKEGIAYKFLGEEIYEKAVRHSTTEGRVIFRVNNLNELLLADFDETTHKVKNLVFPTYIGPYHIEAIGDRVFKDKCYLQNVTLPSTITSIGNEAFMGCHQLEYVIFENDQVNIGTDAFKTQATQLHALDCPFKNDATDHSLSNTDYTPKTTLHFVGNISSTSKPYLYAMSLGGTYNNDYQTRSFPIYNSGWPTCLEVQYVYDTYTSSGYSELKNFPTVSTLSLYSNAIYLTDAQRAAAGSTLTKMLAHDQLTQAEEDFKSAALNLVIPSGVDAIEDGLFYAKTNYNDTNDYNRMAVTIIGPTKIDVAYTNDKATYDTATANNPLNKDLTGATRTNILPTIWVDDVGVPYTYLTEKVGTYVNATLGNTYDYDADHADFVVIDPSKSDFAGCTKLIGLTLGDPTDVSNNATPKEIPAGAFYGTGLGGSTMENTVGELTSVAALEMTGDAANGIEPGERAFASVLATGPNAAYKSTLATAHFYGDTPTLGYHAFENQSSLTDVIINNSTTTLGPAAFWGCDVLSDVDFQDSNYYNCKNSVIYGLQPYTLNEVLKGRSNNYITSDDTEGVEALAPEAFANTNIRSVDLSPATLTAVPTYGFKDMVNLTQVLLPDTCSAINDYAFDNSTMDYMQGSQYLEYIGDHAFDHMLTTGWNGTQDHQKNSSLTISAPANSRLATYADFYGYSYTEKKAPTYFYVYFYDYTDASPTATVLVDTQRVEEGQSATAPEAHGRQDYRFTGWSADFSNVTDNIYAIAQYEYDYSYGRIPVHFYDDDGVTEFSWSPLYFAAGEDASQSDSIRIPTKEGYSFDSWYPNGVLSNIQAETYAYATYIPAVTWPVTYYTADYQQIVTLYVPEGEWAPTYVDGIPEIEGFTFTGWDTLPQQVFSAISAVAQYKDNNSAAGTHTVTYYTKDYIVITTRQVADGDWAPTYVDGIPEIPGYTFTGWDTLPAQVYGDIRAVAQYQSDAEVTHDPPYTVTFYYYNSTEIFDQVTNVQKHTDLSDHAGPEREGYTFIGWDNAGLANVQKDIDTWPLYSSELNEYTVRYYSYDGSELFYTTTVKDGSDAPNITGPVREGYTFTGWDRPLTNVKSNIDTRALYVSNNSLIGQVTVNYYTADGTTLYYTVTIDAGTDAPNIQGPAIDGYTFVGWDRVLTNVVENINTRATYVAANSGTSGELYPLTVVNGSGSGSYAAGTQVIIVANDPASGLQFGSWTVSPEDTKITSKSISASVITMPAGPVTVKANYVARTGGGGSGNGGGSGTGNSGTGGRSGSGTTPNRSGGTTVVIDKNGLSNTGVVSATVNGSSDNFTIKIQDSATASEEILRALLAQYGSLTNIVYFPMDISLYDASGTKKITDTTGLTVTITLPLPDSMKDYAGNNKVACVANGVLETLSPKFTTISGVPCVTFTATHFSPYVIYVNTVELTQGGDPGYDNTPKTGDGIHPKWFLSIALFAISIILFLKKDKRVAVKAKATK